MVKRILGWSLFVIVAAFIGFLLWLFFFRGDAPQSTYTDSGRSESFFPVDINNGIGAEGELTPNSTTQQPGTASIPRVRQLSQVPVAGAVAFERPTGSSETYISDEGVEESRAFTITTFRYIERATGHLYEARENSLTQTRLSNTTIPKVSYTKFSPDGTHALVQYVAEDEETVETLIGKVTSKSTTSPDTFQIIADGYSLEGVYLPRNVVSADIGATNISYVLENSAGGSTIIAADLKDQAKRILHESPFTQWIVQQVNNTDRIITTKADSRENGFAYLIGANQSLQKLLGDTPGLTTLTNPGKTWMLYSIARSNDLELYAYNITNGQSKRLGIKTLPEKCTFSQTSADVVFCGATDQPERVAYPETWYQGVSTFADNLWKVNLKDESYEALLINKEEVPQSFDITKITVSPRDEFILFVNKKDLTLWSVDITKARGTR
ncbi:MAG: hypothetical protein RL150_584 [Candidatus Parcubacteria bacterium]|jgi:hypothetical protein